MKKIAIVEDNEDNQILFEAMLEDEYEIVTYDDGNQALAGIEAALPDIVLMDISLPGMDGVEVLKKLRALPVVGALPVIALTAHAMAGDRERLMGEGFDDYVSKPVVEEDLLLDPIRELLERSA